MKDEDVSGRENGENEDQREKAHQEKQTTGITGKDKYARQTESSENRYVSNGAWETAARGP